MEHKTERSFGFLHINERGGKPRPPRSPPCGTSRATRSPGAQDDTVSWRGCLASRRTPDAGGEIGVVRVLDSLGCAYGALDGEVTPAQYTRERIAREDVQRLLRRVEVVPDPGFSNRFPEEHACRLTVTLTDDRILVREMSEYEGFHTRPMSWDAAMRKFFAVAGEHRPRVHLDSVVKAVRNLEKISVRNLVMQLV